MSKDAVVSARLTEDDRARLQRSADCLQLRRGHRYWSAIGMNMPPTHPLFPVPNAPRRVLRRRPRNAVQLSHGVADLVDQ